MRTVTSLVPKSLPGASTPTAFVPLTSEMEYSVVSRPRERMMSPFFSPPTKRIATLSFSLLWFSSFTSP